MKARGRWFVLLAALFALSWQGIVASAHYHPGIVPTVQATVADGAVTAHPAQPRAPADTPANCPVCGELAHLSIYLPPAPIVFAAPAALAMSAVAAPALFLPLHQRSHAWRSRAPPISARA